jgi:hypothetical protein
MKEPPGQNDVEARKRSTELTIQHVTDQEADIGHLQRVLNVLRSANALRIEVNTSDFCPLLCQIKRVDTFFAPYIEHFPSRDVDPLKQPRLFIVLSAKRRVFLVPRERATWETKNSMVRFILDT